MKIVMSHFDKITKKTRNSNTRNVKFELNNAYKRFTKILTKYKMFETSKKIHIFLLI